MKNRIFHGSGTWTFSNLVSLHESSGETWPLTPIGEIMHRRGHSSHASISATQDPIHFFHYVLIHNVPILRDRTGLVRLFDFLIPLSLMHSASK